MDAESLRKLLIELESDLAQFYENTQNHPRMAAFSDALGFMVQSAKAHIAGLESGESVFRVPALVAQPARQIHGRIKKALSDRISSGRPPEEIMLEAAETEAIIGQVYDRISDHYRRVADRYGDISKRLTEMADEERQHQNYLLAGILLTEGRLTPDSLEPFAETVIDRLNALDLTDAHREDVTLHQQTLSLQSKATRPNPVVVAESVRQLVFLLMAHADAADTTAFLKQQLHPKSESAETPAPSPEPTSSGPTQPTEATSPPETDAIEKPTVPIDKKKTKHPSDEG